LLPKLGERAAWLASIAELVSEVSEVSDFLSLFLRAQAGFVIGDDGVEWSAYG
jgi:hypothetical protein